ncbi:hypothetical protein [Roseateles albus]|uniref:Membrane transporter protein n=1 Tax=Roseateles albus TaxID=2987525 RepID=A0ABT5KGI0_9BURK|nr:hypothetical protein [Roseateles albus]MDC8773034.1 hypothetical protein [Roseateles albus]
MITSTRVSASLGLTNDIMCVLKTTQAIIAIALLILGVVALFGIGITGLLFLVPGVAFAAIAGVTQGGARAAVILALTADTVIAYFAGAKIRALLHPELMGTRVEPAVAALLKPTILDFVVPSAVLALVAIAVVAVLLDWRSVQAAAWF